MKRYEICLKQETVGQAIVERQGLYYKVECRCDLPAGKRYHAVALGKSGQEDLGLLIPAGNSFRSCKSVAVKKLGEGALSFRLEPVAADGMFIPLREDTPIECIDKLRSAVLSERDGMRGIRIPMG